MLAIDPGREKCGLAIVDVAGRVLARRIVSSAALAALVNAWAGDWSVGSVVVGCGTGSGPVCAALRADGLHPVLAVETGTTLAARALYFQENPPTGWRRFVPRGLLVPPQPLDDFAAVLIARRHLGIESVGGREAGRGRRATAGGANGGVDVAPPAAAGDEREPPHPPGVGYLALRPPGSAFRGVDQPHPGCGGG